jgi:hypothetical protein
MANSDSQPSRRHRSQCFAKNITPSSIDPQKDCPLFTVLPPELRTQVFVYMLSESDDTTKPYPRDSYYFRPEFEYAPRIDTALLETCRRIYMETYLLPVSLATHCFWGGPDRGPPNHRPNQLAGKGPRTPPVYFAAFCKEQQEAVTRVHYFLQQFFFEGEAAFQTICRSRQMQTVTDLKITIRHTDWWSWETGAPLGIDPRIKGIATGITMGADSTRMMFEDGSWGTSFRHLKSLKHLQIELETVRAKKNELDAIGVFARGWVFPMEDEMCLALDSSEPLQNETWVGSSRFDNNFSMRIAEFQRRQMTLAGRQEMTPHLAPDWDMALRRPLARRDVFPRQPLEYYVLTLNWRSRKAEDLLLSDQRR